MTEPATVAALYVQRGGCYWNLPGVDPCRPMVKLVDPSHCARCGHFGRWTPCPLCGLDR